MGTDLSVDDRVPCLSPRKASEDRWPVAVVGAGIAGASAAAVLAARGIRVLLIDKDHPGRRKTCGGCLNARAIALLHRLGLGTVLDALRPNRLDGIDLRRAGRNVQLPFPSSASGYSIARTALDAALVREAVHRGAAYLPRARVAGTRADGSCRILRFSTQEGIQGELTADLVLGCDGLRSTLARESGLAVGPPPGRRSKIGVSVLLSSDSFSLPNHWITMATHCEGYVGVVWIGSDSDSECGLWNAAAALRPAFVRARGGVWSAMTEILNSCKIQTPAKSVQDPVACPPLRWTVQRPWSERLLLAGDAAGYIEPFTGEGMAWALTAVEEAVPLAAKGWDASIGPRYEAVWRRRVGRRRLPIRMVTRVLDSAWLASTVLGALAVLPSLGRAFIHRLNDEVPFESFP